MQLSSHQLCSQKSHADCPFACGSIYSCSDALSQEEFSSLYKLPITPISSLHQVNHFNLKPVSYSTGEMFLVLHGKTTCQPFMPLYFVMFLNTKLLLQGLRKRSLSLQQVDFGNRMNQGISAVFWFFGQSVFHIPVYITDNVKQLVVTFFG